VGESNFFTILLAVRGTVASLQGGSRRGTLWKLWGRRVSTGFVNF